MANAPARQIDWSVSADRQALAAAGWEVIEFEDLTRRAARDSTVAAGRRVSLDNPIQTWLDRVAATRRLAVVGVRLTTLDELAVLHGKVLEPCRRAGTALLVQSEQRLTTLDPSRFVDPGFGYAYTLERALDVALRMFRGDAAAPAPTPAGPVAAPRAALDDEQRRAVDAHDGVVQVIAPAGSGKTTVLIERVREHLRRGVPAQRILCTTFNAAARAELQERLAAAGVRGVQARTFHSLGLWILTEEGLVASAETRTPSLSQWKRLCAIAMREDGTWIDPADARAAIGDVKLGMLATAAELRPRAAEIDNGVTIARIYELYEAEQRAAGTIDFDDQVMLAVRALRDDAELRGRWQARFAQVLVDEYQDVEPAQELLVRILAAPRDGLFCVGDEDQTLYAWRRASVRRMIDLDLAYPGLERVSLAHNYRCPPEVVTASRRLIEHNVVRFPKPIRPAPGRADGSAAALELFEDGDRRAAAARIARSLAGRRRGEVAVLARTTNLLRAVALACVAGPIPISAPARIFESRGARRAIEAYLRLVRAPGAARLDDVAVVCRAPSRSLPLGAEDDVAARLREGASFAAAFRAVAADERRRAKLDEAGRVLGTLAGMSDATRFIRHLRGLGGLDEHFADYEDAFGDVEQVELEVLQEAHDDARGLTVAEYALQIESRADALRDIRDDRHGVELATIHGAKGRQWPEVWLFACEEGRLPHRHALEATPEDEAAGEGIEAERRLAYVAFTRAQERLAVTATDGAASRFLTEAGLAPARPYVPPAPPSPAGRSRHARGSVRTDRAPKVVRTGPAEPAMSRRPRIGPHDGRLAEAVRVGLGYALRTAPTRTLALQTAAAALEQNLIGEATTSAKMTAAKLLACVEQLSDADRRRILREAAIGDETVRLRGLDAAARSRLASALRSAT